MSQRIHKSKNSCNCATEIRQRMEGQYITILLGSVIFGNYNCCKIYISVCKMFSAIIIQVRNGMKKEKYMITATKAANCIRRYYYKWKLYKTINKRIHLKIAIPAAVVIQKYYRGWKVLK